MSSNTKAFEEKMKSSVRSLLQFHRIILIFRFRFIPI